MRPYSSSFFSYNHANYAYTLFDEHALPFGSVADELRKASTWLGIPAVNPPRPEMKIRVVR